MTRCTAGRFTDLFAALLSLPLAMQRTDLAENCLRHVSALCCINASKSDA